MKVAYYPGCASHGIAKDVDIATQLIAKDLAYLEQYLTAMKKKNSKTKS